MSKQEEHTDWIAVLICDSLSKQKFWNGSDWTDDIEQSLIVDNYPDALRLIHWKIPDDKVTATITTIPKHIYLRTLREHYRQTSR